MKTILLLSGLATAGALIAVSLGYLWASLAMSFRLRLLFIWQKITGYLGSALSLAIGVALATGALYTTPWFNPNARWLSYPCLGGVGVFGIFGILMIWWGLLGFFQVTSTNLYNKPETERGRSLGTLPQARKAVREVTQKQERGQVVRTASAPPVVDAKSPPFSQLQRLICWGMLELPESEASHHFLVAGSIGSGKTLFIQMLMRSVLSVMEAGQDCRALVFDAKREYYSYLAGMPLKVPLRTFDPFDIRSVAWDVAADIATDSDAEQFAHLLIPKAANETQPYFTDTARELTKATVMALQTLEPKRWSLRDLLLLTEDGERLQDYIEKVPAVMDRVRRHFDAREFSSVLSTLATKLGPLSVVAALWEGATERYSLETWLNESSVLMLASDPVHRESLEILNRAIFARATNLLLAQTKKPAGRSWLFLDEFREAGKLEGARSVLNLGRTKGVAAVLGFQDFDGLCELYGTKEANEITGQCNNKTFLRTDSVATATWMEAHAGRILERDPQITLEPQQLTANPKSISIQRVERHLVMASEFMEIPRTTPENGLRAFHLIPIARTAYWSKSEFSEILPLVGEPHPGVPNFVSRLADSQRLAPWSWEDARRLEIPFRSVARPKSPGPEATDEAAMAPDAAPPKPPEAPDSSAEDRLRSVRRPKDESPEV